MKTFNIPLKDSWKSFLASKQEIKKGYHKADIYFKDGNMLHGAYILNGEELQNVPEEFASKEIKYIQVVPESINNEDKGNIVMEENKQNITKFIKNIMDDDYSEANKTLVNIMDLKVQDRIKDEIVSQEAEDKK